VATVTLEHLSKRYERDGALAVDDVSLTIADGEFMVLLGPSGCGKSTTLRMIAGLESITAGELFIDDQPMSRVLAKDRDIAMVFQSYALYPHMTVAANLAFGLRRRSVAKAEIERRVATTAEMLGLTPLLQRKPHALSGGQRQRVALGRAIVRDPKVFLLDEPLSNLDAALRVSTRGELIKQHRRLATTMIYVTHDQVEAMTMGSRICIMNQGRVVQVGPPLEVYRRPADTFVARFLGSPGMNLIETGLIEAGGGLAVRLGGAELPLERSQRPDLGAGRRIVFGIRPEDLYEPGEHPPGLRTHGMAAEVVAIEPLGAETLLILDLAGAPGEVIARVGRDARARVGERLEIQVDLSALRFFDADTTRALPLREARGRSGEAA
jgi:multiple sugar transport system ATP-binding protein